MAEYEAASFLSVGWMCIDALFLCVILCLWCRLFFFHSNVPIEDKESRMMIRLTYSVLYHIVNRMRCTLFFALFLFLLLCGHSIKSLLLLLLLLRNRLFSPLHPFTPLRQ